MEELRTLVGRDVRFKLEEVEGEPFSEDGYSPLYRCVAENPWGLFIRGEAGLLFIPWAAAGWIRIVEDESQVLKRLLGTGQRAEE